MLASRSVARLGAHPWVAGALVLVSVGLSFLIWFLPGAGYARGGILDGADLRLDMIQILWWQTLVFVATSTIAIALLPLRPHARYAIGYAAAFGACMATLLLLDKLF